MATTWRIELWIESQGNAMRTDILFGIHSEDMEEIKDIIEEILGRELEARGRLQLGALLLPSVS
jgi:hypothetical protein